MSIDFYQGQRSLSAALVNPRTRYARRGQGIGLVDSTSDWNLFCSRVADSIGSADYGTLAEFWKQHYAMLKREVYIYEVLCRRYENMDDSSKTSFAAAMVNVQEDAFPRDRTDDFLQGILGYAHASLIGKLASSNLVRQYFPSMEEDVKQMESEHVGETVARQIVTTVLQCLRNQKQLRYIGVLPKTRGRNNSIELDRVFTKQAKNDGRRNNNSMLALFGFNEPSQTTDFGLLIDVLKECDARFGELYNKSGKSKRKVELGPRTIEEIYKAVTNKKRGRDPTVSLAARNSAPRLPTSKSKSSTKKATNKKMAKTSSGPSGSASSKPAPKTKAADNLPDKERCFSLKEDVSMPELQVNAEGVIVGPMLEVIRAFNHPLVIRKVVNALLGMVLVDGEFLPMDYRMGITDCSLFPKGSPDPVVKAEQFWDEQNKAFVTYFVLENHLSEELSTNAVAGVKQSPFLLYKPLNYLRIGTKFNNDKGAPMPMMEFTRDVNLYESDFARPHEVLLIELTNAIQECARDAAEAAVKEYFVHATTTPSLDAKPPGSSTKQDNVIGSIAGDGDESIIEFDRRFVNKAGNLTHHNNADGAKTLVGPNLESGYGAHNDAMNSALNHDKVEQFAIGTTCFMQSKLRQSPPMTEIAGRKHATASFGRKKGSKYMSFPKVQWVDDDEDRYILVENGTAALCGAVFMHFQWYGSQLGEILHNVTGVSMDFIRIVVTIRQLRDFQTSKTEVRERFNAKFALMGKREPNVITAENLTVYNVVKHLKGENPTRFSARDQTVVPLSVHFEEDAVETIPPSKGILPKPIFKFHDPLEKHLHEHEKILAMGNIGPNMSKFRLASTGGICQLLADNHISVSLIDDETNERTRCIGPLYDSNNKCVAYPGARYPFDEFFSKLGGKTNKHCHHITSESGMIVVPKLVSKNHPLFVQLFLVIQRWLENGPNLAGEVEDLPDIRIGGFGGAVSIAGANCVSIAEADDIMFRPSRHQTFPADLQEMVDCQQVVTICLLSDQSITGDDGKKIKKRESVIGAPYVFIGGKSGWWDRVEKQNADDFAREVMKQMTAAVAELKRLDPIVYGKLSVDEKYIQRYCAPFKDYMLIPVDKQYLKRFKWNKDRSQIVPQVPENRAWDFVTLKTSQLKRPIVSGMKQEMERRISVTKGNGEAITNDEKLIVASGFAESLLDAALSRTNRNHDGKCSKVNDEELETNSGLAYDTDFWVRLAIHSQAIQSWYMAFADISHVDGRDLGKEEDGESDDDINGAVSDGVTKEKEEPGKPKLPTNKVVDAMEDATMDVEKKERGTGKRGSTRQRNRGEDSDSSWHEEDDLGSKSDEELDKKPKAANGNKKSKKRKHTTRPKKKNAAKRAKGRGVFCLLPARPLEEDRMMELRLASLSTRPHHTMFVVNDPSAFCCQVAAGVFDKPELRELDDNGRFKHRAYIDWIEANTKEAFEYLWYAIVCNIVSPSAILDIMYRIDPIGFADGKLCPKPCQLEAFMQKARDWESLPDAFWFRIFNKTVKPAGGLLALEMFLTHVRENGENWLKHLCSLDRETITRNEAVRYLQERLNLALSSSKDINPFQAHSVLRVFECMVHEPFGPPEDTSVPYGSGGLDGASLFQELVKGMDESEEKQIGKSRKELLADLFVKVQPRLLNTWASEIYEGTSQSSFTRDDLTDVLAAMGLELWVSKDGSTKRLRHVLGFGKFYDSCDTEHGCCHTHKIYKNTKPSNISVDKSIHTPYSWPVRFPVLPFDLETYTWGAACVAYCKGIVDAYRRLDKAGKLKAMDEVLVINSNMVSK